MPGGWPPADESPPTADRDAARRNDAAGLRDSGCAAVSAAASCPRCTPARRALRLEAQVDGEHRLVEHVRTVLASPPRTTSPSRSSARRSSSSSVAADRPFIATSVPPGSSSGTHQRASLSSRATARAVTQGAATVPTSSSARPRCTRHVVQRQVGDHARAATACDAASARRGARPGPVARPPGRRRAARPPTPRRRPAPRREGVGDDRAVEHVPVPQPGHLARPDEPVRHPGVGEDLGEPDRERHPLTKHRSRTRGCGWQCDRMLVRVVMFHVKRRLTRGG